MIQRLIAGKDAPPPSKKKKRELKERLKKGSGIHSTRRRIMFTNRGNSHLAPPVALSCSSIRKHIPTSQLQVVC